ATENAIGQTLRLGNDTFEVVGIVRSDDGEAGGHQLPDSQTDAYIPIETARERFGDQNFQRGAGTSQNERIELRGMIIQVGSTDDVPIVADGVRRMLEHHRPRGDWTMDVPLALLRQAEETRRTFNFVLGSIA